MTERAEKSIYENLRKPGTQAISLITFFFMAFTGLIFIFGLKLENTPSYLLASTAVQIIIALIGFIPFILLRVPEKFKGESKDDRFARKMIFLFVFKILSYIVFIQKIIEYFTIPNIAESRFTIIVVGVIVYAAMVFCSNVVYQAMLATAEFKEEQSNGTGHVNHA